MKRFILLIFFCLATSTALLANLTQGHWRWHRNDGDQATASWKADQDAAITITDYKAIRLRMAVYNNTDAPKDFNHELKYATSPDGPWITITEASSINAFILGGDNTLISQGDATTEQLTGGASATNYQPGMVITSQDQLTETMVDGSRTEYEWCIKPTANIRPGTTYYFRSNAGDQNTPEPSLLTASDHFKPAPAALLPNSGFENDLTGWSSKIDNGSQASFAINRSENQIHQGNKALKVTVTSLGADNSVTLTKGNIQLTDTGVYLLRFWAISDTRGAILDMDLNTAGPNNHCHYKIYDRFEKDKNGWQMYQYAFRVRSLSTPITLQMHFNSSATYYLDDIKLINQKTHPNLDITEQYNWQNNFDESFGWISGDNNNPVLLPDSSIAWVFNDSFMGDIDPNTNVLSSGRILNNLIVRQQGNTLQTVYSGTAPNVASLFNPGNGHIFWQSGGLVENGQLKVLLIEISGGNYAGNCWVGSLSLPDLKVLGLTKLPATIDISPNCVMSDGDYDYLYFGKSSGTFDMHTIVARVPAGQLDSQTPWSYYQQDGTWSTDFTHAKNILDGAPAGNVLKLGENNYVMSGVPHLSNEIAAWFAPTPYGPWGHKTVIYNILDQEGILAYEGHLNPLSKDGYYSFTYSVYPFVTEADGTSGSVPMQMAVKSTYLPIYVRAKLMDLSPFSGKKSPDSLFSFTGNLRSGAIQVDWQAANSTDDHYQLQRSLDGINWTNLIRVDGADSLQSGTYQAVDPAPASGLNYYRLAIYNMDLQLNYSSVLQINTEDALAVTLSRFTAVQLPRPNGPGPAVRLNWSTATESGLTDAGFSVERSNDNQHFQTIGRVKTGVLSTSEKHYSFLDPSPLPGKGYYRLRYISGSKSLFSPVRSVYTYPAQGITLKVFPNPALHNKIHFVFQVPVGGAANKQQRYQLKTGTLQVQLMDLSGRVVGKKAFPRSPDGHYELKGPWAAGLYLLQLKAGPVSRSLQVMVQ